MAAITLSSRGVVGEKVFFMGEWGRDEEFFQPLEVIENPVDITLVPLEEAEGIVCLGPFDAQAGGTVFGSGAGVVVLRRLEDAIADRDHIYAVIRGTAINNDGASKAGYLAPSVQGQASCIVEAHGLADVTADSIGYVECHGTGTYLGDPIEVSALTEAFRQSTDATQFCRLGSVKTNIGHLDTAAGVASLIKAALILEREKIPASPNFEKPGPGCAASIRAAQPDVSR